MPLLVWNGTSMGIIGNSAVIFRKKIDKTLGGDPWVENGENSRKKKQGHRPVSDPPLLVTHVLI